MWRGTSPFAADADEALAVVERRTGTAYEPRLAGLAASNFADLLADLDETRIWEQALEREPFPQILIAGEKVDAAFMAIAALTGLKSPWGFASTRQESPTSRRPPPGAWACRQPP